MKSNWNYPTTVWVGENRVSDLSEACKNLNIKKPMFVLLEIDLYLQKLFKIECSI